jgi:hypothetical protein
VGIPNIADLTGKARLIVVGEVIRVDTVGKDRLPYNGAEFPVLNKRAEFRVDATLKGAATSSSIRVVYPENETFESGPLTNALTVGTYCMLFLTERDEGYGFVEPAQSTMPMSRDLAALPYPPGPDTYTRVLQYLSTALFSMRATTQDRLQSIFALDRSFPFCPRRVVRERRSRVASPTSCSTGQASRYIRAPRIHCCAFRPV